MSAQKSKSLVVPMTDRRYPIPGGWLMVTYHPPRPYRITKQPDVGPDPRDLRNSPFRWVR